MPLQNKIIKAPGTNPIKKVPMTVSMIDSDGTLQVIPLRLQPFSDDELGLLADEVIYGIELIINPASLSTNISKIINRTQTMTCFVEDHWGEEIDTISLQGYTASFVTGGSDLYSIRSNQSSPTRSYLERTTGANQNLRGYGSGIHDDEIGITTSQRRKSVSYQHFKRLVDLFRINGCFFDTFGLVSKRYYIMISYGNVAYRGFFESIDVTEVGTNPFRFQYTITFKSQDTVYSYIKPPRSLGSPIPITNSQSTSEELGLKGTFAERYGTQGTGL